MITDPGNGMGVYRSDNAETWTRQENILAGAGKRVDDGIQGSHAEVLVAGERAFVIYFTHPDRAGYSTGNTEGAMPYDQRRTSIQISELNLVGE
jgi:hypothetical protein